MAEMIEGNEQDAAWAELEAFQQEKRQEAEAGTEEAVETTASGKKVVKFDPRKPNRLSRKQIDNLSFIFRAVAEDFARMLGKDLRMDLQIEVKDLVQERYETFINGLAQPSCIYLVDFAPLKAPMLMLLDHILVFSGVDRFLGGSGNVEIEPRELTDVETSITDHFVRSVSQCIAGAWKRIAQLTPGIIGAVSDPERVEAEGLQDVVLLAVMEINGEVDFGTLTLCIPFTALEEHIERIGSLDERKRPAAKDLEEWRNRLKSNLCHVEVGLPVFLGDAEIPISDLLDLKNEDVIVIDKRITEPVEMPVGSEAVIRGNIGVYNDRLALKVMEIRRLDTPAAEVEAAHG